MKITDTIKAVGMMAAAQRPPMRLAEGPPAEEGEFAVDVPDAGRVEVLFVCHEVDEAIISEGCQLI